MAKFTTITEAEQVTPEMINDAVEIADGFFGDSPIEWERLFDRLEGWQSIDLGTQQSSPAMRRIQREVRRVRSGG